MLIRREYLLRGVVQGVGFRPHVARTAGRHPVTGFVGNDASQVFLEVQGSLADVEVFIADVLDHLPALAQVISTTWKPLDPVATETQFTIAPSREGDTARTLIPPDVATCPACLADMTDPTNRRHRYAFTTCTHCGPRLTIITDLPYDRPATTMRTFPMCPACTAEYTDPADRRYHAQPISCYDCGPRLWIAETGSDQAERPSVPEHYSQDAVIAEATQRLRAGQILALKGLGGFHLMCDARNDDAVQRLRERKRRSGKPFAVMVEDVPAARRLAVLDDEQAALLGSPQRPIVIAPMARSYDLADGVAPGLDDVGILLPYAPLHTLLLEPGWALVATSGNLTDEPLCYSNADALERLAPLADAFVLHDRDIHVPVEDSVVLAGSGATIPSRRSRGYAPLPVVLPDGDGPVVLGVGGELKNTFTLAIDDLAHVSAHLGDMGSWAAQQAFEASVAQMLAIQGTQPDVVVCDLHPRYATASWAKRYAAVRNLPVIQVQHHHAHALALLAEHGIASGQAVVATLDGTGYGTDGTIWGGEILTVDARTGSFERSWHLPTFPLVGGDKAVRSPWRMALGLLRALDLIERPPGLFTSINEGELRLVESQLDSGLGITATSSAGRLFDAASALLGICRSTTYEAQAAMELEREASRWASAHGHINLDLTSTFTDEISFHGLVRDLLDEHRAPGERAWRFHVGFAHLIGQELMRTAQQAETSIIGVTGGVAMNRLFLALLDQYFAGKGFHLAKHAVVPPNDGGLSLGQAWAGRLLAP